MTPECRRIGFDVPLLAAVTRQAGARLMLGRYAKLWPADSHGNSLVNCHYIAGAALPHFGTCSFVLDAHLCCFLPLSPDFALYLKQLTPGMAMATLPYWVCCLCYLVLNSRQTQLMSWLWYHNLSMVAMVAVSGRNTLPVLRTLQMPL